MKWCKVFKIWIWSFVSKNRIIHETKIELYFLFYSTICAAFQGIACMRDVPESIVLLTVAYECTTGVYLQHLGIFSENSYPWPPPCCALAGNEKLVCGSGSYRVSQGVKRNSETPTVPRNAVITAPANGFFTSRKCTTWLATVRNLVYKMSKFRWFFVYINCLHVKMTFACHVTIQNLAVTWFQNWDFVVKNREFMIYLSMNLVHFTMFWNLLWNNT